MEPERLCEVVDNYADVCSEKIGINIMRSAGNLINLVGESMSGDWSKTLLRPEICQAIADLAVDMDTLVVMYSISDNERLKAELEEGYERKVISMEEEIDMAKVRAGA